MAKGQLYIMTEVHTQANMQREKGTAKENSNIQMEQFTPEISQKAYIMAMEF